MVMAWFLISRSIANADISLPEMQEAIRVGIF
jgi:hypothetical protein